MRDHIKQHLPLADQIDLIVSSPLRRTLQTARLGLSPQIEKGVPTLAYGEWQEIADYPCDTGSALEVTRKEYPEFDYSNIDTVYPAKTGAYAFTRDAVVGRGKAVRHWLRNRPEKVIAVVTHSAFLRTAVVNYRYANADYRVFEFVGDSDDLKAWEDHEAGAMGRSMPGFAGIEDGDFPA